MCMWWYSRQHKNTLYTCIWWCINAWKWVHENTILIISFAGKHYQIILACGFVCIRMLISNSLLLMQNILNKNELYKEEKLETFKWFLIWIVLNQTMCERERKREIESKRGLCQNFDAFIVLKYFIHSLLCFCFLAHKNQ